MILFLCCYTHEYKINEEKRKNEGITHAYVHWLADVQLAGFAPAFTLLTPSTLKETTQVNKITGLLQL